MKQGKAKKRKRREAVAKLNRYLRRFRPREVADAGSGIEETKSK